MAIRKLLILSTLLFSSCAYFNTVYNAKLYFKEAEKIYREQGQNTMESSTNYNKTIEKSSKVFEFYPESDYIDDALYLTAVSYKRLGDYTKAKIKFEELFNYFPDSPYAKQALIEYIDLLVNLNYLNEANMEIRKHPEIKNDPEFILINTKLLFTQKEYESLINLVEREWNKVLKNPMKKIIFQLALESAIRTKNWEKAQKFLEQIEKIAITDNERIYLIVTRADMLANQGKFDEAQKILDQACFQDDSPQYRILQYEKARLYSQGGNYEPAISTIEKILEKPQRDSVYTKTLFLKGKIMETLDSLEQAIAIYENLRNSPLSKNLRDEIEMRYNSLIAISSEENSDQSKLRKAELYLLDLGNVEKALELYQELIATSKDNEVKAKAMYAAMIVYRNYLNDEQKASELARRITSEFPNSYQASKVHELNILNVTEN